MTSWPGSSTVRTRLTSVMAPGGCPPGRQRPPATVPSRRAVHGLPSGGARILPVTNTTEWAGQDLGADGIGIVMLLCGEKLGIRINHSYGGCDQPVVISYGT